MKWHNLNTFYITKNRMPIIKYLSTQVQFAYDLESTVDLDPRSDAEVLTELLVNTYIYNLIITTTKPNS